MSYFLNIFCNFGKISNLLNYSTNYSVMYIENFIDAFDLTKSKYKYNEKYDMYTFMPKQTFLNLENCKGYDIFRCSKSVAGIYVSEKFYEIP